MPNPNSAAVRPSMACLREKDQNTQAGKRRERRAARRAARDALAQAVAGVSCDPATPVESLEPRQLMSVSHSSAGFTVVTPSGGDRVVYVSSSQGSDSNNGLSASSPVKTVHKAQSMLRNGTGDEMLLKRGDTWHESFSKWTLAGQSASNPMVIGAYGTGSRPTLATGNNNAFVADKSNVHDLDIIGIHLTAAGRSSGSMPDGIQIAGRVSNLLVEDCEIDQYRNNITLQAFFGPVNNITIRRSSIHDSYSRSSHSEGIYAEGVHGITLQDNVLDHNGWGNGAAQTMFNHDAYITGTSSGLVATGNIFANASSHGLQARPGGTVENNLFYNNAIGLSFGMVNGGGPCVAGGVTGTVQNNVFVGGHDIGSLPAGIAMVLGNIKSASVSNNLIADGPGTSNAAIQLGNVTSEVNANRAVGINNLTIANNVVYNWMRGISVAGNIDVGHSGPTGLNNLTVSHNDFQRIRSYQAISHYATFVKSTEHWSGNRYDVPGNRSTPMTIGSRGMTVQGWNSYESGAQDLRVSYPGESVNLTSVAASYVARARTMNESNFSASALASAAVAYLRSGFRGNGGTVPTPPVISVPADTTSGGSSSSSGSSTGTSGSSNSGSSPALSVNNVSVTEGDSGTRSATFTVRLSKASSQRVNVRWTTNQRTASVSNDYSGANGTLTFNPGQTSRTVTIKVRGDNTRETNEQFVLDLTSATGATLADREGTCTIVNDD